MTKSEKKSAKLSTTSLAIRIVLIVALAALVVLGLKDVRARQAAQASLAAVSAQMDSATDAKPFLKSHIKPLLVGVPTLETADHKAMNEPTLASAERYSWPGAFRSYKLTIGYSLGNDPEVEIVEGPK